MTDGESTPFGGAKADESPQKARKASPRTPASKGPKRSSTIVMENPEVAPASPAPASASPARKPTRKKTAKTPPPRRRATTKMAALGPASERESKTAKKGAIDAKSLEPVDTARSASTDDDDDDDDVPTRSKSMDWANPAGLEARGDPPQERDNTENEISPASPHADETLADLAPLTDDDFTFTSDDDDDDDDPDPMGHMPTQKEMPSVEQVQRVTLVNGVDPKQRKKGEVVRVTDRHVYVLAEGETRRIGRKAGFELPPGGSWSAWRLSGEDHKRWKKNP